jgi:hypothetical protein
VSLEKPYNPLDKQQLGESVAMAMLARPVHPLPPAEPFAGAGIYAIYYQGNFEVYRPIADRNQNDQFAIPIYVGKAIPSGARRGNVGLDIPAGQVLFLRLREHAESIRQATNLELSDFHCRYLVVDDIWIPLGESLLITKFLPPWNVALDGFGNHDPGSRRYNQQRSSWDVVHPGRPWAEKCAPNPRSLDWILESLRSRIAIIAPI